MPEIIDEVKPVVKPETKTESKPALKKGVFPYIAFLIKLISYVVLLAIVVMITIGFDSMMTPNTAKLMTVLFPVAAGLILVLCLAVEMKQLKDWKRL